MNIYKRQMKNLGTDLERYAQLLETPVFIVRKLINGEELDNNMKLNEFIRKNVLKQYEKVENDFIETKTELIKEKLEKENKKKQEDLFDWYKNEFNKEELLKKYGCFSVTKLYNILGMTIRTNGNAIISKSTFVRLLNKQLTQKTVSLLLEQLYEYYTNEQLIEEKLTKLEIEPKKKKDKLEKDELKKWHLDFDYQSFMETNNLKTKDMVKELNIPLSTMAAITSPKKTYSPSKKVIEKVKDYVERKETKYEFVAPKEFVESIEPVDFIEEEVFFVPNKSAEIEPLEKMQEKNKNANNDENVVINALRELVKERLTEQEKSLIKLFGGKI